VLKPCWAISRANVELKTKGSEISPVSIISSHVVNDHTLLIHIPVFQITRWRNRTRHGFNRLAYVSVKYGHSHWPWWRKRTSSLKRWVLNKHRHGWSTEDISAHLFAVKLTMLRNAYLTNRVRCRSWNRRNRFHWSRTNYLYSFGNLIWSHLARVRY
jgi:hypothetical protein